jgi:hypothetical protein
MDVGANLISLRDLEAENDGNQQRNDSNRAKARVEGESLELRVAVDGLSGSDC